jgi:hypothetical protein
MTEEMMTWEGPKRVFDELIQARNERDLLLEVLRYCLMPLHIDPTHAWQRVEQAYVHIPGVIPDINDKVSQVLTIWTREEEKKGNTKDVPPLP